MRLSFTTDSLVASERGKEATTLSKLRRVHSLHPVSVKEKTRRDVEDLQTHVADFIVHVWRHSLAIEGSLRVQLEDNHQALIDKLREQTSSQGADSEAVQQTLVEMQGVQAKMKAELESHGAKVGGRWIKRVSGALAVFVGMP